MKKTLPVQGDPNVPGAGIMGSYLGSKGIKDIVNGGIALVANAI